MPANALVGRQPVRLAVAIARNQRIDYSKKLRPASPPTLSIHQASPTSKNSTVSPFENLAPAWRPLITTSTTVVSANDLRNCHEAGVQFPMRRCRSQLIRSQGAGVMYVHVPGAAQRRSPPAKSGAHVLPTRSISCSAESRGPVADVDASGSASFPIDVVDLVSTVWLSEERSASTPATTNTAATPPTRSQVTREGCRRVEPFTVATRRQQWASKKHSVRHSAPP